MSKPTMLDRADDYMTESLPLVDRIDRDFWQVHLAAFAAQEVARVREVVEAAIKATSFHLSSVSEQMGYEDESAAAIRAGFASIEAATRQRPARAKAQNDRAIGHPARCICWRCATPEQNRRALARAAKKGKSR